MHVLGTAGHVDHGKSTLVKALTGIDPDRLREEKEREMTIDLGFAWLTLPSGLEVSIVDVPGHEDFIKNMLAGVGGIDVALFVIAADEGVMPQTREHLAILDLLGVHNGVVALTKSDLVNDPEWLALVEADISELFAGTTLANAAIIPVSAKTGYGLPELLAELERILSNVPEPADLGRPRLPIDRVFTVAGFGTVVTGTLLDGQLHIGQEVEILPPGIHTRIRGLQSHKTKIDVAKPSSRVAVNLTGVSTEQLARGQVLTLPGLFEPTQLVDARLRLLPSAPKPLRHDASVDLFLDAAVVSARVRLLEHRELLPGEEGWVQLRTEEPIVAARQGRFIVRQASPSLTLGGGTIVDPHPSRRYRRFRPEVIARLEQLVHGTPQEILLSTLERLGPVEVAELMEASGLNPAEAEGALSALHQSGQIIVFGNGLSSASYVVTTAGWSVLEERLSAVLANYHRQYPLRVGMPREELKSRLGLATRLFQDVLAMAVSKGIIVEGQGTVRLADHRVQLSQEQQARVNDLLAAFDREPYAPPSYAECEQAVGPDVLATLFENKTLIRLSDSVVFRTEVYERMVEAVVRRIRTEGKITLAQVRDMFGTSRKYAQALLEYLDEQRVTRRVGDERVLR
ncbi:MAG: selenocysteine-specific translation elongation factor [Chloroflexi bacterium]|nr:selenocysteine-specific translation elongation factor [Chloroflexota bacterium]